MFEIEPKIDDVMKWQWRLNRVWRVICVVGIAGFLAVVARAMLTWMQEGRWWLVAIGASLIVSLLVTGVEIGTKGTLTPTALWCWLATTTLALVSDVYRAIYHPPHWDPWLRPIGDVLQVILVAMFLRRLQLIKRKAETPGGERAQ
jgi:O-antigen/teichoic acid export membrane protein